MAVDKGQVRLRFDRQRPSCRCRAESSLVARYRVPLAFPRNVNVRPAPGAWATQRDLIFLELLKSYDPTTWQPKRPRWPPSQARISPHEDIAAHDPGRSQGRTESKRLIFEKQVAVHLAQAKVREYLRHQVLERNVGRKLEIPPAAALYLKGHDDRAHD